MSFNGAVLREAVARVRSELPALPILIGGHAVEWSSGLPHALAADTAPSTPEDLVEVVRRVTGVA